LRVRFLRLSAGPLGVTAAMRSETAKRIAKRFVLCGIVLFLGSPYVGLAFGMSGPHDSVLVYIAMAFGGLSIVLGVVLALISMLLRRNPT